MKVFPSAFVFDDGAQLCYAPKAPRLTRHAGGKPQISLIETGSGGFLTLATEWTLREEDLEALRVELDTERPLVPMHVSMSDVTLLLGDGFGGWSVLQAGPSSGTPPYTRVFNVMLNSDQLEAVKKGLEGEPGHLSVRYEAHIPTAYTEAEKTIDIQADQQTTTSECRTKAQASFHHQEVQATGPPPGPLNSETDIAQLIEPFD